MDRASRTVATSPRAGAGRRSHSRCSRCSPCSRGSGSFLARREWLAVLALGGLRGLDAAVRPLVAELCAAGARVRANLRLRARPARGPARVDDTPQRGRPGRRRPRPGRSSYAATACSRTEAASSWRRRSATRTAIGHARGDRPARRARSRRERRRSSWPCCRVRVDAGARRDARPHVQPRRMARARCRQSSPRSWSMRDACICSPCSSRRSPRPLSLVCAIGAGSTEPRRDRRSRRGHRISRWRSAGRLPSLERRLRIGRRGARAARDRRSRRRLARAGRVRLSCRAARPSLPRAPTVRFTGRCRRAAAISTGAS